MVQEVNRIQKIVTHAGCFHADEVLATAFLLSLFPEAVVERTYTPSEEDFNNPQTAVLDIGRRYEPELNNFDHHQDAELPASNMLVLGYFGESYATDEIIKDVLFRYVSDVDTGKIVEPSTQKVPTFNSVIRMLNNVEGGFEIALQVAGAAIVAAQATAKQKLLSKERWNALKKVKNNVHQDMRSAEPFMLTPSATYAITDDTQPIIGWQELAEEEGINFLVHPNLRGGYSITSRDSSRFPIPSHETQTFLHNAAFTATYPTKESAVKHLENF